MMKAFVDTSFFIALADKSDKYYENAKICLTDQANNKSCLITSNAVLSETITWLRYRAGFKYAKEFGEKFRLSRILDIIWIDSEIEKKSWEIFLKYADKELSYVDCLSFACMKMLKIESALTFDDHFRKVGYLMIPEMLR